MKQVLQIKRDDAFVFAGFAPKKKGRRQTLLNQLATSPFTNIFYESPQRIISLLKDIRVAMGDRACVVAREMTKLHEEFLRGSISEILDVLAAREQIKGECTVLVAGNRGGIEVEWTDIQGEIKKGIGQGDQRPGELAKTIAEQYGVSRKKVYDEILRQKENSN